MAELIVLESGFFGAEWDEEPQTESPFDYSSLDGCGFLDDLRDADGSLIEVESPEFSQFDTLIEHDVRIYPDVETAIDVVVAWAQDPVLQCTLDGAITQAQAGLDAGELAPFSAVDFDINRFDDLVGEPRVTNFEIMNTLTNQAALLNQAAVELPFVVEKPNFRWRVTSAGAFYRDADLPTLGPAKVTLT